MRGGRARRDFFERDALQVSADLPSEVRRLRRGGCQFGSELVEGAGGRQILLADPSGNLIELTEPHARRSG